MVKRREQVTKEAFRVIFSGIEIQAQGHMHAGLYPQSQKFSKYSVNM